MWTAELMRERSPEAVVEHSVYVADAASGRAGMRILAEMDGVTLRAMAADDWAYLVSLCDHKVQDAFARRGQAGSPFTEVHLALRAKLDAFLTGFIDDSSRQPLEQACPINSLHIA